MVEGFFIAQMSLPEKLFKLVLVYFFALMQKSNKKIKPANKINLCFKLARPSFGGAASYVIISKLVRHNSFMLANK